MDIISLFYFGVKGKDGRQRSAVRYQKSEKIKQKTGFRIESGMTA